MINFSFLTNPTNNQIKEITNLYRLAGWWSLTSDNPQYFAKIISGSHSFLVAVLENRIIGMGRAISDGISDAYIQDVTVEKDYRKCGTGTKIVEKLVNRLSFDGLKWIGLIAERNSHEFYAKLGFKKMENSTPMLKTIL